MAATNKDRRWLIWGTIGVFILIAILFIALVDFDEVLRQLGRANWQYLLVGSVLLVVGYLFYALRWRSLLPQGIKLFDVFHAGNSGQMINTWIPSRLGILVRTTMISQEYELHLPQLIWISGLGLWGFFKGPKIKLKELMADAESKTNRELSEAAPEPKENESTKRKT